MSTDAEAADDVATPPDTTQDVPPDASEDVEVGVEPRPLSACDGPGGVFVAPADEALVDVEWLGGDLVVRGYAAACGADEVAQELRVRSACGGAFDVTLSTRGVEASVEASLRAEGVLDAAGEPVVWTGAAALESPAAGSLDLQTQVGEEGAFDLVIEVACAAGTTAHWSLVLDTPSTADTPMAANGWGVDMAPEVPESAQGCGVGDTLPNLGEFLYQYGNSDVSLGQFAGDVLVLEIGAMWCAPCRDLAPGLAALSRRVELDPAFGFTLLSSMGEDERGGVTDGHDLVRWANEIEARGPVLGGPAAMELGRICDVGALPTTLVIDPNFVVRDVLEGSPVDVVGASVDAAWRAFRGEQHGRARL